MSPDGDARVLRVVLQQLLDPVPGGIGRYATDLTRALHRTAPDGWRVEGATAARDEVGTRRLTAAVPELGPAIAWSAPRRVLSELWRRGVGVGAGGRGADAVFAPSLLAPVGPRTTAPTFVTIHDTVPWTNPETLTPRGAAWHQAMGIRVARSADVVTVPTAAVGDRLAEHLDVRGRILVVPGAPSGVIAMPADDRADTIRRALGLPARYVLFVGTLEPRKGLRTLIEAFAEPALQDLDLVIVGPSGWGDVSIDGAVATAGVAPDRVHVLGRIDDEALAVAYASATALCMPSIDEGFGLPLVEAMRQGVPVVHSDAPALVEVAGGAGLTVPRPGTDADVPGAIAAAVTRIVDDAALRDGLVARGRVRAAGFSWDASARTLWGAVDG